MLAVSDSTPLIHLAKINKIIYLKKLFKQIFIPREINEEVIIKGKEFGKKEVAIIEDIINEKFIVVRDASFKIELPNLHLGEMKALALCKEMRIKSILIDEKEGYDSAVILGLSPLRTTSILLKLLSKRIISLKDYEKSLLELSESGYFLSAETYQKLLDAGRNTRQ